MVGAAGRTGLGEGQEFHFGHVEPKVPGKQPAGNETEAGGKIVLELKEQV